MHGEAPGVHRALALLNVSILPSLSEGLSIGILQAIISGKRVVAIEFGGTADIFPSQTALFVACSLNNDGALSA